MSSGFPKSWYPVLRSRDLRPGRHLTISAFGEEWLLFRTRSGRLGLTSIRCCHMGVHLGLGRVQDETFECPLHGWAFAPDGRCVHIPLQASVPDDIRLSGLVCRERWGVIFAFWGESPAFEIPSPPDWDGESVPSAAWVTEVSMEYHTPSLNTFDVQHFERIHNRRFVEPPKIKQLDEFVLRIDYEAAILRRRWVDHIMAALGSRTMRVTIDCWGSSLLLLKNQKTGFGAMVAMCPIETGRCRVFILAFTPSHPGSSVLRRGRDRILVGLAAILTRGFLRPDLKAITGMRPFDGRLIKELDWGVGRYWDYWRRLPRWEGRTNRVDCQ